MIWARIHRHDERIEKNEESIRQYKQEKALQAGKVQKRKGPQLETEAKRRKVRDGSSICLDRVRLLSTTTNLGFSLKLTQSTLSSLTVLRRKLSSLNMKSWNWKSMTALRQVYEQRWNIWRSR